MTYAVSAKKRHPKIKLCLIIPDLLTYVNSNKFYRILGLQRYNSHIVNTLLHSFDCNVVLTEPMIKQLNVEKKPIVVIEGIYSGMKDELEDVEKLPDKTILYSGGIQTRYGVFDLMEAVHLCEEKDLRLILCGPCIEMKKLNQYVSSDDRIEYRGVLSTKEVRLLQKQVMLLVNPRHSTEDFTKYSFPSKTLEYMASGTPVLMCPLPSIPEEYKQYLFLFDDETISGFSRTINRICNLNKSKLLEKGKAASDFIKNKKNAKKQVLKICSLLNSL